MSDRDWDIFKASCCYVGLFIAGCFTIVGFVILSIYTCNRLFPDPTPQQYANSKVARLQGAWYQRCSAALSQSEDASVPLLLQNGRCYSMAFNKDGTRKMDLVAKR